MKIASFLRAKKPAYALIYTLLFIVLLLITISVTWVTGMLDIRMARQSEYSTQAYQMAEAAIESGYAYYRGQIGNSDPVPTVIYPSGACLTPAVHRVTLNGVGGSTETDTVFTILPNSTYGAFDFRVCSSNDPQIEGIGYYKGSKITLKAIIVHRADAGFCINPPGGTYPGCNLDPTAKRLNHPKDYITIYQTGPSQ